VCSFCCCMPGVFNFFIPFILCFIVLPLGVIKNDSG